MGFLKYYSVDTHYNPGILQLTEHLEYKTLKAINTVHYRNTGTPESKLSAAAPC